jgi:hypothetical protein
MARVHLASAFNQIHRLFDEGTLAGLPVVRLLERYLSERDDVAFETIVKRHGRMVMSVCQGVVRDANDADDAFQAAFLLLVFMRLFSSIGSDFQPTRPWVARSIPYPSSGREESELECLTNPHGNATFDSGLTERIPA